MAWGAHSYGGGIPAVVAMRRSISASDAGRFTRHFYRNLARSGRVDTAANEARQQLHLAAPDRIDWSTPVLFMRLQDGRLWKSEKVERCPLSKAKADVSSIGPFRGLEVFREQDERFFFGREEIVQQLTDHLWSRRFLVVLGPSGCGKSSVVQAGLIPRLRRDNSLVALLTPREEPLAELAFALRGVYSQTGRELATERIAERLKTTNALHFMAREVVADAGAERLVIVIDQFEELFTQTSDAEERRQFLSALLSVVNSSTSAAYLILTMRSDFVGKCANHPALNTFINQHFFQVGAMSSAQLRRVIEEPARLAGLAFEEGLVDRILSDVAGSPGEMPLLEHALLELYERRQGARMTLRSYEEIQGVEGALARRAEMEFVKLDTHQQEALRRMFVLRLVQPGDGTEDTRRRATREELLAVDEHPEVVGGPGRTLDRRSSLDHPA